MNGSTFDGLFVMAAVVLLSGCTFNTLTRTHSANASAPPPSEPFLCESVSRQKIFIAAAEQMNLSQEDALRLYSLAGSGQPDVVTGFAPAPDREPTVDRAIATVAKDPTERAFYVEVDIQNLGGLNEELGHTGANDVYRDMARMAEQSILALDGDACSFRHGGDEFSFLIIGTHETQQSIEAALDDANRQIKQYIADKGLANLKHPKHLQDPSKWGAGIIFGVSQIRGQEDHEAIFSTADLVVERKKQQ